jgi:hypothetical protein
VNRCSQIFLSFLLILNTFIVAQNDTLPVKNYRTKKIIVASSASAFTAGSLLYLSKAWYMQYNNGKFIFFNDNSEWLQMDKVGHFWSTYNTGRLMMDAFDWAGASKKQKLLYGGTIGFAYMTCIEVMDGCSKGWGFSYGDMIANAAGSGLAIAQEAAWNEQRVFVKYSYHQSDFAAYNPNLLGKNLSERLLKDYNAQIYWLSVSPFNFIKSDKKLPKWLALSLGYGASGMIRAKESSITYYSNTTPQVEYYFEAERIRNFYVSIDLDLTKIKTKSKFLKTVFTCLNTVKIPAPAVLLNKNGAQYFLFR